VKAIERGSQLRNDESAVAWFYRILRNAVVDHYRRTATRTAALEEFKRQTSEAAPDPKLQDAVCECVRDVAATLKPDYAAIVNDVDVEGLSVEEGIGPPRRHLREQWFCPPAPRSQGPGRAAGRGVRRVRDAPVRGRRLPAETRPQVMNIQVFAAFVRFPRASRQPPWIEDGGRRCAPAVPSSRP
jgi:hypothetical protein